MSNTTSNATTTKSGTGFTVDVTVCNLLPDLTIKDFNVLVGGTLDNKANWEKTSQTLLTYVGTALGAGTSIEVRRATPENRVYEATYGSVLSSTLFNEELNRVSRRAFEYAINGTGAGAVVTSVAPLDQAYGINWAADSIRGRTANRLYDKIETLAPLASPALTGTPTAPTAADATNDTQLATTAFTHSRVTNELSSSPALGGTPTAPTAGVNTDSTQIATTAFVRRSRQLAFGTDNSATFTVSPSTAYSLNSWAPVFTVNQYSGFISMTTDGIFNVQPGVYKCTCSFGILLSSGTGGNFLLEWRSRTGGVWSTTSLSTYGNFETTKINPVTLTGYAVVPVGADALHPFFVTTSTGSGSVQLLELYLAVESVRE